MSDIPNIYDYLDFRLYLSDWFDAKKKENPRYSHRMFVRQTGQKSPSFLSDVIKGRRKLTLEAATAFCRVLKLKSQEQHFFLVLVEFHQNENDCEKDKAMREILTIRKVRSSTKSLEGEAFEILSKWEYIAVHELAKRKDFRIDPSWIAKNLQPPITSREARNIVETLFSVGLFVKDSQGNITNASSDLRTPALVQGLAVRNYHRSMLQLAQESMNRYPTKRRHLEGLTVAVPASKLPLIKAKISECLIDIQAICLEGQDETDEVLQINMNVFPLSTRRKKSK